MARLIDADALKYALSRLEATGGHKYYRQGMDDVLQKFMPGFIDEQPTVDAVEVVRCKDCRNWRPYGPGSLGTCHSPMYPKKPIIQEAHFCSYGERKPDISTTPADDDKTDSGLITEDEYG